MKKRLLLAGAAIAATMYGEAASAQEVDVTNVDDIVVTGSRIKRQDISGVGPATVVTGEDIERTGITNVETLLQRLPASAGAAGNQTNSYWTGNGYGTAQVNLRGLGINRTLTLINGRRVVNGGTGANSAPDLNMIPTPIIARMDVLKDGASAIYGADAVAGVVNIITVNGYEGLKVSGKYGVTDEGDGQDVTFDVLWGIKNDRGGVTAALTYQKSEEVNLASRAPCGLGEVNGALTCLSSATTPGGRAVLPNGQMINFNQTPGGDGDFYEPYDPAKHNHNSNGYLNASSPIERFSTAVLADYQLTDSVSLFGELFFTHRESNQMAAPGALRDIRIAADHPTNPTGQDLLLIRRLLVEPGQRQFFQETDTYRFVGGARGDIAGDWTWEASANWGRNTGVDGMTNIVNLQRLGDTLNTSLCSPTPGAAVPCGDYLGMGDVNQDVLDYILFNSRDTGGNEQKSFTFDVSGTVMELPAGALAMAAGLVYREEKGWRDPDALTVLGISNTNQQDPIAGETKAKEAYVELSAPLLSDLPFVQRLELDGAVRYSDYDMFGGETTYKLGLNWTVVDSLRLRATYGTGFRIPSVPELFGGVAEGNLTTTDPCSRYNASGDAVLIANCAASGVPAGYVQMGTTILTTVGGNPNLEPEDADTLTAGIVWTPTRSLTLTLDYYSIKLKNAIQSVAGSTKLATCYNSPNRSHIFCSPASFTRNPATGEIDFLSSQPVNAADEQISGFDLGLLYEFSVAGMRGTLSTDVSHLKNYQVRPFPGAAAIDYTGKITGGRGSYTQWRSLNTLTLVDGPLSGSYTLQYIGAAKDINAAPTDIGARAPAVMYHSMQVKYAFNKSMHVSLGVDNLFDKKAPFIKSYTDANTDTMTYDLLGRRWHMRLGYRW